MLADNQLYRVGAVAAILGVAILLVRQTMELIHPMGQPGNTPENAAATFAEYAAYEPWVATHLLEFLGFAFVFGALVVVSWRLRAGRARGWALLGALGAGVTMKAIVQDAYGPPDVLELRDIDKPEITEEEMLVRVHAAGVGREVWHIMTGLPYGIFRFSEGKVVESWDNFDQLGMLQQLGAIPSPEQPAG